MKPVQNILVLVLLTFTGTFTFSQSLWTSVDNLRLRAAPDKESETLMHLPEGTQVMFLNAISQQKEKISLRGTTYDDHWVKVVYFNPEAVNYEDQYFQGWVYGGAVKFYHPKDLPNHGTTVYPVVDWLSVRKSPNKDAEKVGSLREGQPVTISGKPIDFTDKVTLRGVTYDEPWVKIHAGELEGWVYAGGLRAWREKSLAEYMQGGQLPTFLPLLTANESSDEVRTSTPILHLQNNDTELFGEGDEMHFSYEEFGVDIYDVQYAWKIGNGVIAIPVDNYHPSPCVSSSDHFLLTFNSAGLADHLHLYESGYYRDGCNEENEEVRRTGTDRFEVDTWVIEDCDMVKKGTIRSFRIDSNGKIEERGTDEYTRQMAMDR